jgi:hypothetical protein
MRRLDRVESLTLQLAIGYRPHPSTTTPKDNAIPTSRKDDRVHAPDGISGDPRSVTFHGTRELPARA